MVNTLSPKDLSEAAGISRSHASMILGGRRKATTSIALDVFRKKGIRLGLLADLTDADLDRLCGERKVHTCQDGAATAPPQDALMVNSLSAERVPESASPPGRGAAQAGLCEPRSHDPKCVAPAGGAV